MPAAAGALRDLPGPVLLTTGRGGLEVFAAAPHRFVIRTVDPPDGPLPTEHVLLLSRGPYALTDERALLAEHGVRVLVTKDSGGNMTAAKLVAARELGADAGGRSGERRRGRARRLGLAAHERPAAPRSSMIRMGTLIPGLRRPAAWTAC
jgi:hypothetical protein